MSDSDSQYPEHFVERLEIVWGEGFLSPGGADEVREILRGLALAGKAVLDIGCGTGGADLVLVHHLGAAQVLACDVEPALIERARRRVEDAGLSAQIEFRLVESGPLAFPDESFDLVFSKDAMVHIPDKPALFGEVFRVLRPGGVFAASDWLGGAEMADSPAWARYRELGHLSFAMATAAESEAALRAAGFTGVASRDRNAWYAELSREEVAQIAGPLREPLIAAAGAETYAHWLEVRRALNDAVADGSLRPTHLRGRKP